MGELDEKLNGLLSDPDSMAQIMQMARQLSGALGGSGAPASPPPPASQEPPAAARSDSPVNGLDPALAARFLPLLQEYSRPNTQTMQLLQALQPFLKPEKQDKIQRAARLARIIHIGKKFFTEWEG